MPQKTELIKCSECGAENLNDSKFCSKCGEEIVMVSAWADDISNKVIAATNEPRNLKSELERLRAIGFKGEITESMKLDILIFYMFGVNKVVQSRYTKDEALEINQFFHNTLAAKLYKNDKDKQKFFDLVKSRYEYYYDASGGDDKAINFGIDFIEFLCFGENHHHEHKEGALDYGKAALAALDVVADFTRWVNWVQSEYFKK